MSDERRRMILRLYDEAAALAPIDRAPFLRKACGGDQSLRAEIESLLRDDTRLNALLEPKGSHRALIGQRIGGYEIRSLLGVGGMGEVYRARGERFLFNVSSTAFANPAPINLVLNWKTGLQ